MIWVLFSSTVVAVLLLYQQACQLSDRIVRRRQHWVGMANYQVAFLKLFHHSVFPSIRFWPIFAGIALPQLTDDDRGKGHCIVRGRTGSGKTLVIDLFSRPIMKGIAANYLQDEGGIGGLWHDHKGSTYPELVGEGVPTFILNPYDERGYAWDIGADVNTRESARYLADFLIPARSARDHYWINAPRNIIRLVITYLIDRKDETGQDWDLVDLFYLVEQPALLQRCCSYNPTAQRVLAIFEDAKSAGDVFATLESNVNEMRDLALCWRWHRLQGRSLSLNQWVKELGSVLLLGPVIRGLSVEAANRLVFSWVSSVIFRLPDNPNRQVWFVFDELNAFKKPLDQLPNFLTYARSKGGRFVAGVHDERDLEDIYGRGGTSKILSSFSHLCVLRSGLATAKWTEDYFGKQWVWENTYSKGWSGSQRTSSTSSRPVQRPQVEAHHIVNLQVPSVEEGLLAYYKSPLLDHLSGSFTRFRYTGHQVEVLRPKRAQVPAILELSQAQLAQTEATAEREARFEPLAPEAHRRGQVRSRGRHENNRFPAYLTDPNFDVMTYGVADSEPGSRRGGAGA